MTSPPKQRSFAVLVDGALIVLLILALFGVYRVESSSPPPPPVVASANQGVKVKVEKGLTGDKVTYELYEIRTAPKEVKMDLIRQLGGTQETEQAVQNGLDWLVRHQSADGSWSGLCLGQRGIGPGCCEGSTPCAIPGGRYQVGLTGLSLLALQAAGHYECNTNPYSAQVKRGIDWLISHQGADGEISLKSEGPSGERWAYMYEHAMAAFALSEACAVRLALSEKENARLRAAAVEAIKFIESQQHNDGGWRYTASQAEPSDSSVTGWVMLALKSAREAKIDMDPRTIEGCKRFLDSVRMSETQKSYTKYNYAYASVTVSGDGSSAISDPMTAVGMLTDLLLLKKPDTPLVKEASEYLASRAGYYHDQIQSGNTEFYTLYNVTLAMYQVGGDRWNQWNNAVRDGIVGRQTRGTGCDRGSWDPRTTTFGTMGGRIYSTALGTLMLEVYYRYSRDEEPKPKKRAG